jgi:hypothetical protein
MRADRAIAAMFALGLLGTVPVEAQERDADAEVLFRTSQIAAAIHIPMAVIRAELEKATPRSDRGSKADPVGGRIIEDEFAWDFSRTDLAVSAAGDALNVTTTISGTARLKGKVKFGAKIPFSAHTDLRAAINGQSRPKLAENWRLHPNLSATAEVQEATVPVARVGRISVRRQVQRAVDAKIAQLRDSLEARLREDPRIEREARKAWAALCRAAPVDVDKDGSPDLYLRVAPALARASQPVVSPEGIRVPVSIEAKVEISTDASQPACPFPAAVELQAMGTTGLDLAVPVDLPFARINDVAARATPKPVRRPDLGLEAEIRSVAIEGLGAGRVLARIGVKIIEAGSPLAGFEGTVLVAVKPRLDARRQVIVFDEPRIDVQSKTLFSATAVIAQGAAPLIEQWIANEFKYDVTRDAAKVPAIADAAVLAFNLKSEKLEIGATLGRPGLEGLLVRKSGLRLYALASGSASVTLK